MSAAALRGNGSTTGVSTADVIQLLDPTEVFGTDNFYYDFFIKAENATGAGIWQIDNSGYGDMAGASGVSGEGHAEWLRRVQIGNAANTGLVRVNSTGAGEVSWWYALSDGAGYFPTVFSANGSTSSDVVFYFQPGYQYDIVSDGNHSWDYWDGSAWQNLTNGTAAEFNIEAPATRKVRMQPTGAVNFTFTSHKL